MLLSKQIASAASLIMLVAASASMALVPTSKAGDPVESLRRGAMAEPITPIPSLAPPTSREAELGHVLFDSPLLSRSGTRSCASCHDTATNGAEALRVSLSPSGQPLARNAPSVFNAGLNFRQNWDGKARTLQDQAAMAIADPGFMDESWDDLLGKVDGDPQLVGRFREVFGRLPDRDAVLDALAAYEDTLRTPGARFDLWLAGDATALSDTEKEGYRLFKSAGCISCHQGTNVGGNLYEDAGVFKPLFDGPAKLMRVPSLRNVAVTAPYFDDGSAATLDEAVRRMAEAQLGRKLSRAQIASIVAFLDTLTGRFEGRPLAQRR